MPKKPLIQCVYDNCNSGKIHVLQYYYKADRHITYDCLCRLCARKFTVSIRLTDE